GRRSSATRISPSVSVGRPALADRSLSPPPKHFPTDRFRSIAETYRWMLGRTSGGVNRFVPLEGALSYRSGADSSETRPGATSRRRQSWTDVLRGAPATGCCHDPNVYDAIIVGGGVGG